MKVTVQKCVCILGFCLFLSGCGRKTEAALISAESESSRQTEAEADEADIGALPGEGSGVETNTAEESELWVYICGEVRNPGVYTLPYEARICDAVDAAGGMTEAACRDYWNLAEPLTDGQMIDVPTEEEAEDRRKNGESQSTASSGSVETEVLTEPGIGSDGRVNINTATKTQLMTVPGIGEAKAGNILAYREEHGSFSSIDEIKNVTGIKDGLFQKVKDYITVD